MSVIARTCNAYIGGLTCTLQSMPWIVPASIACLPRQPRPTGCNTRNITILRSLADLTAPRELHHRAFTSHVISTHAHTDCQLVHSHRRSMCQCLAKAPGSCAAKATGQGRRALRAAYLANLQAQDRQAAIALRSVSLGSTHSAVASRAWWGLDTCTVTAPHA